MRLVTFSEVDRQAYRAGVLITVDSSDFVIDLQLAGAGFPRSMRSLLQTIDGDFEEVAKVAGSIPQSLHIPIAMVSVGPVITDPEKVLCIGLNYRDHAIETGHKLPTIPTVFAKCSNALIGNHGIILLPTNTTEVDYEAELAFIIGRRAKNVSEETALDYVAGYAAFNDVSARDFQLRTTQWTMGKSFDTFAPLGPFLVTKDEVPDPHALRIKLSIGDEWLQDSNTENLVFRIPQLISYISSVMTLEPGDVIATGTPGGVGFTRKPPRYLQSGDRVRVEIERLGILENYVQAAGEQYNLPRRIY